MKVKIISAPSNLGYLNSISNVFPEYLHNRGLEEMLNTIGIEFENLGAIKEKKINKSKDEIKENNCKLSSAIARFNRKLAKKVEGSVKNDQDFPLVIGGDHNITIGTVAGLLRKRKNLGVLLLDAHPDIHTPETTLTGWVYGMSTAVICGFGDKSLTTINKDSSFKINPDNLCIFGVQFIDPEEYRNIKKFKTHLVSLDEIMERGIAKSLDKAIKFVTENTEHVHLSLDLDVVDEQYAPGTSESSKGQFTYREIKYICRKLSQKKIVNSMDIVEGEPAKDIKDRTAKLSLELIASILGKSYSEYNFYIQSNKISCITAT